ncbi:MAG TPA: hypothetical protein VFD70_23555 [Anaerolineae bacterium]|nr:hypothetical protein [Anaerolineae bacterium]
MKKIHLLLLLALALVISCTAAPMPTTAPAPTPMPIQTSSVAQTPPPTLPDDVLVIYHKTGGIAGVNDTLTVHQGGLLELVNRQGEKKTANADEAMIQPVRRMLEQKDFGELQPTYSASGADLITYTITARDSTGAPKTVVTMDSAPHPPFLGQLIVMLDQLQAAVR